MGNSDGLRERRKNKRFFPKEWVSASCQASIVGIGKLGDISKGGVSFQYVQHPGIKLAILNKSLKLDLFETVTSQGVKGIMCNVVYDTEVPKQNISSGGYRLRRCGVEFGRLSRDQSSELDLFIKDFTAEES
jgi:hypothetical protein